MFERRAINRIGLNDLGLGHQIVNILRDGGIDNLKQLRNLVGSGDGALLAISGIGPKRLELVKQALG
jgi:DNA polymerase/3'-5' exonuclease PolX